MYRLGRHSHRKHKKHLWRVILLSVIVLCALVTVTIVNFLQDDNTKISKTNAVTREYAPEGANPQVFTHSQYEISLPTDWRLLERSTDPYTVYRYQAGKKGADNRWLEVYVDRLPPEKAVNRLMPVQITDNKIKPAGPISDNCTLLDGTRNPGPSPVASSPVSWQGIQFLCDRANYTRNVVGVGSTAMNSRLVLSGPKGNNRTFIIIYTDHNANPDYYILSSALQSLEVR